MFRPVRLSRIVLFLLVIVLVFPLAAPPVFSQSDPILIETGASSIETILFSPDSQSIAVFTPTGLFKYDVATGALLSQIDGAYIRPTGKNWAWGASNDSGDAPLIDLWSSTEFTVRNLDRNGLNVYLSFTEVSEDGNLLVSVPFSGMSLPVYDISSGVLTPLTILEDLEAESGDVVSDVTFTPDGTMIIGNTGDSLIGWDIQSGVVFKRVPVASFDWFFSTDRRYLVAGMYKPELWDVTVGSRVLTININTDTYYPDFAFSSDNQTIATIVELDETLDIQLIDAATGAVTRTVASYSTETEYVELFNSFRSIDLSPDGRYVAASSISFGTVVIWDLQAAASAEPGCVLTAKRDTAVRGAPSATAEQVKLLAAGEQASADGQTVDGSGFGWYRLNDLTWVRAETVDASAECAALPSVTP